MEPLFRRGKMIIFSTRSTDAMPCRREIVIMGDRAEVRDYHAAHTGRMGKRAAKSKPTPEAVRRAYLRKKERELRWLMNANFRDRVDALVTFSWPKGERPAGYREVLKAAQQLTRSLRKEYRNYGLELKYVYTMEIGPKGSRHIHMVLSNANLLLLYACWPYATIDVKPLWSDGDYGDIAAYFIKYWEKTSTTEGMKLGRRCYNPSMNLRKPEIIRETIPESAFAKDPPEIPGFILEKGSVVEGVTEVTGRRFRECRYRRDKAAMKPLPKPQSIFRKALEAAGKIRDKFRHMFRRGREDEAEHQDPH